jgi:predicted Holliday junction resolvase-like endonuclease
MELENTFYVIAIVFMSLMTLIILALVIAVFAIKAKINAIHQRIEEKVHAFMEVAEMGETLVHKAKDFADRHKK